MAFQTVINGIVSRLLPQIVPDTTATQLRLGRYGEELGAPTVANSKHALADEGTYLVATNPTIGTGLTWVAAQTAFSDTAPNFYIQNPSNQYSVYLDYLKLISTAIGTAAVSWQYAVKVDQTPRTITTNNLLQVTPVIPRSALNPLMTPIVYAQNSATVSALSASSASARIVGRGMMGGVNIVGHTYVIQFGALDVGPCVGATDGTAAPGRTGDSSPPIIIDPGQCATIYIWAPSSTASINPEFELGMWTR